MDILTDVGPVKGEGNLSFTETRSNECTLFLTDAVFIVCHVSKHDRRGFTKKNTR